MVPSLNILRLVNNAGITNEVDKPKIVAIATALAIASRASLPSGPVDSVYDYFLGNHKAHVEEQISRINEGTVFDTGTSLEVVVGIYKARYTAAFMTDITTLFQTHFTPNLYAYLSEEVVNFAAANSTVIYNLACALQEYLGGKVEAVPEMPALVKVTARGV